MRGSIHHQIVVLFEESGIFTPGQSKHCAKQMARSRGFSSSHDVSKDLGIFSYQTAAAYLDIWHQCATLLKNAYGVRNVEDITAAQIKAYLCHEIESGISYRTFQQQAAGLQKFERALNLFSSNTGSYHVYDFESAIHEAAEVARETLQRNEHARAYRDPYALISALAGKVHRICGLLQVEGGARIHEVSFLREDQLRGVDSDAVTNEPRGIVHLTNTKGGLPRDIKIMPTTYSYLQDSIQDGGVFTIDVNPYRHALMIAASKTGQAYQGSHGLRWNYAQTRFRKCMDKGFTYEEALTIVSKEMGHRRSYITLHYLVPTVE